MYVCYDLFQCDLLRLEINSKKYKFPVAVQVYMTN